MKTERMFLWCPEWYLRLCGKIFKVPHVHISIRSLGRGDEWTEPECGGRVLRLEFDDLDPKALEREGRAEDLWKVMKEEQAEKILEFVSKSEEMVVVVNCEAGISRSAGVVLGLRRVFGGDTEEVFEKARPNIHVSGLIGKVAAGGERNGSE